MVASDEAIIDAKFNLDKIDKFRVGVIWGAELAELIHFKMKFQILLPEMELQDSIPFSYLK